MPPISPYAALAAELRLQAARHRAKGSMVDQAAALIYIAVAGQLDALEAHDLEHAAIWRQRWEHDHGAGLRVDLAGLDPEQLEQRIDDLVAHREAAKALDEQLEAEILGVEIEQERRP